MKKSSLLITLVTLLPLVGCGQSDNSNTIYTSFYPIYDLTKRIVGDKFEDLRVEVGQRVDFEGGNLPDGDVLVFVAGSLETAVVDFLEHLLPVSG